MIHAIKYHGNPFKTAFTLIVSTSLPGIQHSTNKWNHQDAERNLTFTVHPTPLLTRVHNL